MEFKGEAKKKSISHLKTGWRSLLPLKAPFLAFVVLALLLCSNCRLPKPPDQSVFAPLQLMENRNEAVVRLYGAKVPKTFGMAIHMWFLVKPEGAHSFDRWELWQIANGPYGHVRKNLTDPESDVGAGETVIWEELVGAEAEHIGRVIAEMSPLYPYRDKYVIYPGPNSNTYIQWILNQSGWAFEPPWIAIGKNYSVR